MSLLEFQRQVAKEAPFANLSQEQMWALWRHFELLTRWNARMNLTRVAGLAEASRIHYAESLFAAIYIPAGVQTVIDVGSGAGFPGFVLAVARPDLQVTLLESDQRKAAFLREASDLAPNVRVLAQRSSEAEGHWDLAVSRAVRADEVLEFARRTADWAMLIGSVRPEHGDRLDWQQVELPGGRGRLWVVRLHSDPGAPG
jgi:16S rRNA (guanine527-N7)-methyltransferase